MSTGIKNYVSALVFARSQCWEQRRHPPATSCGSLRGRPTESLPVGYTANRWPPFPLLSWAYTSEYEYAYVPCAKSGGFKVLYFEFYRSDA